MDGGNENPEYRTQKSGVEAHGNCVHPAHHAAWFKGSVKGGILIREKIEETHGVHAMGFWKNWFHAAEAALF